MRCSGCTCWGIRFSEGGNGVAPMAMSRRVPDVTALPPHHRSRISQPAAPSRRTATTLLRSIWPETVEEQGRVRWADPSRPRSVWRRCIHLGVLRLSRKPRSPTVPFARSVADTSASASMSSGTEIAVFKKSASFNANPRWPSAPRAHAVTTPRQGAGSLHPLTTGLHRLRAPSPQSTGRFCPLAPLAWVEGNC